MMDTGGAEKSSQLRVPDAGLWTPAGCQPRLETHASPAGGATQAEGVRPQAVATPEEFLSLSGPLGAPSPQR